MLTLIVGFAIVSWLLIGLVIYAVWKAPGLSKWIGLICSSGTMVV
ncbi:MAG: hypothetical protein ACREJD_03095 [Phycisphaerales bacterium]